MKQFLTPTPKQYYTIAKDFNFLLYPFNLGWREDDKEHPFKGVYHETLYGKIDKKGEFKIKMDCVHGPTNEVHEHNGSWGSNKERMSLRECFVLVDSNEEKNSKFVQAYSDKKGEWIFGNAPKEITYSIFTDFYNNSKNDTYTIAYPKPHDYSGSYEKEEFGQIISKEELPGVIKFYQDICQNTINVETDKFNLMNSTYKVRFDKKVDQYIPIEYTLPAGTKFKFIKFGVKYSKHQKKKDFVELEINGYKVLIKEEDFSGIWVE